MKYDGVELSWKNIKVFSHKYLTTLYELEQYRYTKSVEKRELTAEERYFEDSLIVKLTEVYKVLVSVRLAIRKLYNSSIGIRKKIDEYCKNNPVFWINSFYWTYDPRIVRFGLAGVVPLVMYDSQSEAIQTAYDAYKSGLKVAVKKSRAEGATEIFVAFSIWIWLYQYSAQIGWGSRVRDLVDKIGDSNSIFEKTRRGIKFLPSAMTQFYDPRTHTKMNQIQNKKNKSDIIGGGGKNIGRGGRATVYLIDEFAFLDNPDSALSSINSVSPCNILISTVNGMNAFYKECYQSNRILIQLAWWKNPSKNDKYYINEKNEESFWYKTEKMSTPPELLAQEIDMDFNCVCAENAIKPEWTESCVNNTIAIPDENNKVAGLDVIAGGNDKPAFVWRKGNVVQPPVVMYSKTPLEIAREARLHATELGITTIVYDKNGFGSDIGTEMSKFDDGITWIGIVGQSSAPDNIHFDNITEGQAFLNYRSYMLWNLRTKILNTHYFVEGIESPVKEDEVISLPEHEIMKNQISIPRLIIKNNKIQFESKDSIRQRGLPSPDILDATAMCFCYDSNKNSTSLFSEFNYSSNCVCSKEFDNSMPQFPSIAIVADKGFNYYLTCGFYDYTSNKIIITNSEKFPPSEVNFLCNKIRNIYTRVVDAYTNESIFDGVTDVNSPYFAFRKNGVVLRPAHMYNLGAMIDSVNELFLNNLIGINMNLEVLLSQLSYYNSKNNKLKENYYYIYSFMVLISALKKKVVYERSN